MASLSSLLIAVLAFAAAALGYTRTHSILLTVVLFLAIVMIGRTLQPIFLQAWAKFRNKHFPRPELTEFYAANMPEPGAKVDAIGGNGLRVLAVTEALRPNAKNKPLYLDMVQESMEALRSESPLVALRLDTVQQRSLPTQYVATLCEKDGKKMRKCFRTWLTSDTVKTMGPKAVNKELFLHDGEIAVPGQAEPIRYSVMLLFDSTLPTTHQNES